MRLERAPHVPPTAFGLESLLSLGAIEGGAALMLGPEGELLPLPLSALRGSPFGNSFWPGCLLFTVLGIQTPTALSGGLTLRYIDIIVAFIGAIIVIALFGGFWRRRVN